MFAWFFFEHISEFNNRAKTESREPTSDEIASGITEIPKKYKWFYTLHSITDGDKTKESYYINLSVNEMYLTLKMRSEINEAERKYQRLITEKSKRR